MTHANSEGLSSKLARDIDCNRQIDGSMLLRGVLERDPQQALNIIQKEMAREQQNGSTRRLEIHANGEIFITDYAPASGYASEGVYVGMNPGQAGAAAVADAAPKPLERSAPPPPQAVERDDAPAPPPVSLRPPPEAYEAPRPVAFQPAPEPYYSPPPAPRPNYDVSNTLGTVLGTVAGVALGVVLARRPYYGGGWGYNGHNGYNGNGWNNTSWNGGNGWNGNGWNGGSGWNGNGWNGGSGWNSGNGWTAGNSSYTAWQRHEWYERQARARAQAYQYDVQPDPYASSGEDY